MRPAAQLAPDAGRPHLAPMFQPLDVVRAEGQISVDAALRAICALTGRSPLKVLQEFIALTFGPGRVSFGEYVKLRLFDDDFYPDKRTVSGRRRTRDIWITVNYRIDWYGVLADKVASTGYLAAFGFPVIPFTAIYCENNLTSGTRYLRDREELRAFLADESRYPLFGKPIGEQQSLGSIGLRGFARSTDCVERSDGVTIALDDLLNEITAHYAAGYMFQDFVSPDPAVRNLCGDRLATVRAVTVATETGPKLFRACWKIPAGRNSADNYWRTGNVLGQLDYTRGRVLRAVSGSGLELTELAHHPDTGAKLVGAQVPNWDAIVELALAGAKLMQHVPMIGWDIAPAESGPIIVEMNETPDLSLNQLADKRGILEQEFLDFMSYQRRNARDHKRHLLATLRKA